MIEDLASREPCQCIAVEQIILDQEDGDNYCIVLQRLIEERGIYEEANNSYCIDFAAIRADAEQKQGHRVKVIALLLIEHKPPSCPYPILTARQTPENQ